MTDARTPRGRQLAQGPGLDLFLPFFGGFAFLIDAGSAAPGRFASARMIDPYSVVSASGSSNHVPPEPR